jgi:hypothetical protein
MTNNFLESTADLSVFSQPISQGQSGSLCDIIIVVIIIIIIIM